MCLYELFLESWKVEVGYIQWQYQFGWNKKQYEEKIEASSQKYDVLKQNVLIEKQKADAKRVKQSLRNSLFKNTNIGDDLNFNWVNKDNIFSVYDAFFESYKENKSNFTREDYDEVKMIYEALDSRKNTVENEGLSTDDNAKIASIKLKFAPMFKVNRVGAKAREMEEAKK